VIEYLRECFNNEISSSDYDFPKGTPIYLKEGYSLNSIFWQDNTFVLVTPRDESSRLPTLKKHFYQIQDRIGKPCAMNLKWLTPLQRTNLIEEKIPFISGKNQIYLPFWGCVFQNKYKQKPELSDKMTPTTQLVFLWSYYSLIENKQVTMSSVSTKLGIPTSSVSRAFIELTEYGLVKQEKAGTVKRIALADEPRAVLNKALQYLSSPVSKRLYLKTIPTDLPYLIGGVKALPNISSGCRDGSLVFGKKVVKDFQQHILISKREFDDFGGYITEIWKYDPGFLTDSTIVDDLSLFVSLKDDDDERIQKELDGIRTRYGIRGE